MCLVSFIFAIQDALSRQLGAAYPPVLIVMIRYWFFALFVVTLAARSQGGLRAAVRSRRPGMQVARGLLLVAEVVVMIVAYVQLGLVETHAIFTVSPLLVVALSGPVLGERIGWRRWVAVAAGFAGILVILQPGLRVFSPWAALPLLAALMFAAYGLLTRMVARDDSAAVSFFWTGLSGAVGITLVGVWRMEPIARADWPALAALCACAAVAHYLLIRAYELAEASSLQPFAYTQLVWVSLIGFVVFGERVGPNVVIGATVIVAAGLFTWWRSVQRARPAAHTPRG
ncbi:DMT family transporter [Paracoccus luteus]|uniref:DMT family transporter n=1 Tax=Paracoccus luteus TaxID=2508543 RepID=UPI00142FFCAA|nr:DMT family transporter [Paracoccus luteus]